MTSQPLLFERFISRPRSVPRLILISLVLLLLPFLAAILDGQLGSMINQGMWRYPLVQPVVIIYILVIAPVMDRVGKEVVESFRPLVLLDDESYERLVFEAGVVPKRNEIIALSAGIIFGILWTLPRNGDFTVSWFTLYWVVANAAMFGLLTLTIYLSFADTRVTTVLHNQPLKIDLFDLSPFQAMGKQSLAVALVFVGGILLSLIFGAEPENVQYIEFWVLYIPMALVPVVIFFMTMRPTHQVLAQEKNNRLQVAKSRLNDLTHELESYLAKGEIPQELAARFNALTAYHQRLRNTRTWPYNTSQLRTLFFSVLIPGATMLLRLVLENLSN